MLCSHCATRTAPLALRHSPGALTRYHAADARCAAQEACTRESHLGERRCRSPRAVLDRRRSSADTRKKLGGRSPPRGAGSDRARRRKQAGASSAHTGSVSRLSCLLISRARVGPSSRAASAQAESRGGLRTDVKNTARVWDARSRAQLPRTTLNRSAQGATQIPRQPRSRSRALRRSRMGRARAPTGTRGRLRRTSPALGGYRRGRPPARAAHRAAILGRLHAHLRRLVAPARQDRRRARPGHVTGGEGMQTVGPGIFKLARLSPRFLPSSRYCLTVSSKGPPERSKKQDAYRV